MPNYEIKQLAAGLYFVATPIGNARDITLRALDTLASVDVIAAEDTRTARKLMDIHAVPLGDRRVLSYHDHSGSKMLDQCVELVLSGKSLAYVSEAGSPLVSDPGFELGRAMISRGCSVFSVPGATAAVTALTVSGLASDSFAFCGFLPSGQTQRRAAIAELQDIPMTLMFYESPRRIGDMLMDLRDVLGALRQAAVCRELTKKFETVERGSLEQLAASFDQRTVKGEIVVIVERAASPTVTDDQIDTALRQAMETMRVKDAATTVAGALGLARRDVYQRALKLGAKL